MPRSAGSILLRTAAFGALWWILAEGRPDTWWLGLGAIAAALAASLYLAPPRAGGVSLAGLASFLGHFLLQSVRGGVQVAAIAFGWRLALRPDVVEFPVELPPGAPRVVLTAALGLMPGTVSVALDGDRLLVHVLDARMPVLQETRALERHVARLFGLPP